MYPMESEGPNDFPIKREIDLDNGNKLFIRRTEPFGFFQFSLAKGNLPDWIKGNYTTMTQAEKAMDKYLRERDISAVEEVAVLKSTKVFNKKG